MGTFSDGMANKMIDAWTGKATFTANAGVFVKLHIGDPGSAGTANAAANTTRHSAAFASSAASRTVASTADVVWATSETSTETITWVSFWDASTAGNFLGRDDLPASQSVTAGNTFTISSGNISLTVT